MTASTPFVSVVTPVHNGGRYLAECIESVLGQSYSNFEYVIVNNASTDDTKKISENYAATDDRIRVVDTDALLPIMENWNFALSLISPQGKYCKVVHADDWLYPACIDEMVRVAEQQTDIALVGAYSLWRDTVTCTGLPSDREVFPGDYVCMRTLKREIYPFLSPSCLLVRSELIRGNERFYEESLIHADVDMCYRLLEGHAFGFAHQVLTFIRWHDESVTQTIEKPWSKARLWNLDLLLRYGPLYLSRSELDEQINHYLAIYYRELARARQNGMPKPFWEYHIGELSRLGLPFSRANLRIARLLNMLEKIRTSIRRKYGWSRRRR